ncbi:unnamed protein product [Camellia sinensis]
MEAKLARLGSSLLVPSVQELAKESLTTVPPRYVHHDHQNHPISSYGARCPHDVPIIDMDKLISGDHMDLELKKLNYASKEWGFFQLINHGVSFSLVEKVKMETQEFFNLPMEEKKKFWQDPGGTSAKEIPLYSRYSIEAYSAELKSLVMKLLEFEEEMQSMEHSNAQNRFKHKFDL